MIDEKTLNSLKEATGSAFNRIADLYFENAQEIFKRIEQGIIDNNAKDIQIAAHSLKSSSGQFGADDLYKHMEFMEEKAEAGDLSDMPKHLEAAKDMYKNVEHELKLKTA